MGYASFIAYVVSHVQERIDAHEESDAATQAAVFWERLLPMLASTEGNVAEGIERLRAADEPAWLAFFAGQNASGPPAGRDRMETQPEPGGGGCSPSRPRASSIRSSGSPATGFPTLQSELSRFSRYCSTCSPRA